MANIVQNMPCKDQMTKGFSAQDTQSEDNVYNRLDTHVVRLPGCGRHVAALCIRIK